MCTIVLADLARELGAEAATRFVHDFVDVWPVRRQRIHAAIGTQDLDGAIDAAFSLRSAALMAGACPLAAHAASIRATLHETGSPAWEYARRLLVALDELGDRTVKTLAEAIALWQLGTGN
ncbi:hypothetical protein ACIPUB_01950 [Paeniglutamicibacter sp. ORCA_105]|uniref:hypothetical protein n=1 Tax=Paeniglutamicibacter sp. ORCA_105 TaxID=3377336 RepID=UPI0038956BDA